VGPRPPRTPPVRRSGAFLSQKIISARPQQRVDNISGFPLGGHSRFRVYCIFVSASLLSFASFWFPLHSFALLTMLSSENPAETCTAVQPCYHGRRVYSTNSSRSCAHARARKKKRNLAEPCGTLRNLRGTLRNLPSKGNP